MPLEIIGVMLVKKIIEPPRVVVMPIVRVLVPKNRLYRAAGIGGEPHIYRDVPPRIGTAPPARPHILDRDLRGRRLHEKIRLFG